MAEYAPGRYWLVRKPTSQGAIVAKFGTQGETQVDARVANHNNFVIQELPGRSALIGHEIDRSGLTDYERKILGFY